MKLGLGFFGATYRGDLTPKGSGWDRFYPGFNASLQFANQKFISPQLNGGFGRFISQNRDQGPVDGIQPNTFVETAFFYVDLRLKARFLRQKKFSPYLSIGAGLLGYTPRDEDNTSLLDDVDTRADGETYGSLTAGFPLSAGFELKLSPIVSLGFEYTNRRSGTDYLDNISQLGSRKGKDRINSITANLFLTFDPQVMSGKFRGKDSR